MTTKYTIHDESLSSTARGFHVNSSLCDRICTSKPTIASVIHQRNLRQDS